MTRSNAAIATVPIQWILQSNLPEQRSPISASCSLVRRPASIATKGIAHRLPDMSGVHGWQ
jgi:hypothetical protein